MERVHEALSRSLTDSFSSSTGARMLFLPVSLRIFLARLSRILAPRVSLRKMTSATRRQPLALVRVGRSRSANAARAVRTLAAQAHIMWIHSIQRQPMD